MGTSGTTVYENPAYEPEEEEVDTTQPFKPSSASTPAPSDPYHGGEAH